jgi:hypothetical protein
MDLAQLHANPDFIMLTAVAQQGKIFASLWGGLVACGTVAALCLPEQLVLRFPAGLLFATLAYTFVWAPTYRMPSRLVHAVAAFAAASIALFHIPEDIVPTGPLIPRHLARDCAWAYLLPFAATFLPGAVLFYLRLSRPLKKHHWRRTPVLRWPYVYPLVIMGAVSATWVGLGVALSLATTKHPAAASYSPVAQVLVEVNSWVIRADASPLGLGGSILRLVRSHWQAAAACIAVHSCLLLTAHAVVYLVDAVAGDRLRSLCNAAAWKFAILLCTVTAACLHAAGMTCADPSFIASVIAIALLLVVGYVPDREDTDDEYYDEDASSSEGEEDAGDD